MAENPDLKPVEILKVVYSPDGDDPGVGEISVMSGEDWLGQSNSGATLENWKTFMREVGKQILR